MSERGETHPQMKMMKMMKGSGKDLKFLFLIIRIIFICG
jgi:hypothetical protein